MQRQSFDHDWRFQLGHKPDGMWKPVDDSTWQVIDLPHDWSMDLRRGPEEPSGASGGYFPNGVGWYQKSFAAPEEWRGKKVVLEFEGVYMNADIWLNGHFLTRHPYGYTSFHVDLTPYIEFGSEQNKLKVAVDNGGQLNSRWYSGSGIYRHVWLMVADPVHVAPWGVAVSTPAVSPDAASVQVRTTLENERSEVQTVKVAVRVLAPDGSLAAQAETSEKLPAGGRSTVSQECKVARPQLWSPDSPHLYRMEIQVRVAGQVLDTASTVFGIRRLEFDAKTGFRLNGQSLKLKGGCVHHDNGVMGSAAYDRSEERKVEVLRASGFNAVRCAHNPPSPGFLDACDRLGMLVIDEAFDCWRNGKNLYDYHVVFDDWWERDVESMVRRDFNHPSVIVWSIGNELVERGRPDGARIARELADRVRALDSTRPVTAAINGGHDNWPWEALDPVFASLDVAGYNYHEVTYRSDHERHPERVIFGTESVAKEAFKHWMSVLELDHVIGDFVWTSLDYLGESGIGRVHYGGPEEPFLGRYPWHQAYCGDLDLCGFKRPQSYYRDVLWGNGSPLYIAVHSPHPDGQKPTITYWGWPEVWPNWSWTGREGKSLHVDVYSRCEQVELFLNGRSLGVRPTTQQEEFIAHFDVPYAAGTLKAVGLNGGRPAAEIEVQTVGEPAALRLTPDRATIKATRGDLSFVTAEVVDAQGRVHPTAEHAVTFSAEGEGEIAAVGNGNPISEESYRGNQRQAHRGRCLVVVKSLGRPGQIRLRATADGLQAADVTIQVAGE